MVIVDTTVWIDYLRGADNPETGWLDRELQRQRLGLTDLILCEVLQGIRDPRRFDQVQADLLKFHIFPTAETTVAIAAAQNYQDLRQRGYTIRKTIDCLIATFVWKPATNCCTATMISIPSRSFSGCKSRTRRPDSAC